MDQPDETNFEQEQELAEEQEYVETEHQEQNHEPGSVSDGWKRYLILVWDYLKKVWRVMAKHAPKYFWIGVGYTVLWTKRFWQKKIVVRGRQVKLAWLVLGLVVLVIVIWLVFTMLFNNGPKTKTYKNKVYNYKVEVPKGWQTQESDMGVLTLTEGDEQTGSCVINILSPMLIPDKVSLETFARGYRDQLENKFDFVISTVKFGKYKEAIKMHIKNGEHQNEDWYFARENGNALVFQVEEYRRGQDGGPVDCEKKLNTVLK